tara:strand:+ start:117 stop:497 length:381 start_codon:yes stop_codon:yes gene_type:complete
MSNTYLYKTEQYGSETDVDQAVMDFKLRLDNNPTDWATVKQLGGDAESGWIVPTESLTDAEINSLGVGQYYSISSVVGGGSELGLTATETTAKVAEYLTEYARYYGANTIIRHYAPTNVDMSGYVT